MIEKYFSGKINLKIKDRQNKTPFEYSNGNVAIDKALKEIE